MWTDTHIHLDASEFDADRDQAVERAISVGVTRMLIPAVHASNFETVQSLARRTHGAVYMLGIHPMYVKNSSESDLDVLRDLVEASLPDPQFAGIGEIGLDGFIDNGDMDRQIMFFQEQLKIAKQYGLPVVMHVRKAQDLVLKALRKYPPVSGIAHAFNGSLQQAQQFVQLNCALGFGGAATFDRALQIRRLIQEIPLSAIVLETDSPDIAPAWRYKPGCKKRNEPAELPAIAQTIASVRGISSVDLSAATQQNAERVIPAFSR